MTELEMSKIHRKVWNKFRYRFDDKNYGVMEDWRSHADAVNRGEVFTDDCDGFAFTMVELMIEAGFPRDKVLFIVCETETGEGHAVSGYEVDGTTYIAENRYESVYDWNDSDYNWMYFMRFDNPGQWYKVTND